MSPTDIHRNLQLAYDLLAKIRGHADGVAADTAFAIGEALGVVSRAKALVGRDIDRQRTPGVVP